MHGNFPALAQHLFTKPNAVVAPGLTNFHNPFFAIHVYRDLAVGIAQAHGLDDTSDFKFLIRCPRSSVMSLGSRGSEESSKNGKTEQVGETKLRHIQSSVAGLSG